MKIAIVGAGWAGLSAALSLQQQGQHVTVFDAAPAIGGRARSIHSSKLGLALDNGQHILISAYTETLNLFRALHGSLDAYCTTLPLSWESADGSFALNVSGALPDRLALGWGLLNAKGLNWPARWRAALALGRLAAAGWKTSAGTTVEQWLNSTRQPAVLRKHFWYPLCLATMNTPPETACAQLFAHVLRDSLGQGAQACRIVLPRVTLGELWSSPALRCLDMRLRHPVRQITLGPAAHSPGSSTMPANTHSLPKPHIDGECFDRVIIATPWHMTLKLLQGLPVIGTSNTYVDSYHALTPLPIATLYLRLAKRWQLPRPMLMLDDAPERCQFGQWVFDRAAFIQDNDTPVLSVVISNAGTLAHHDEATVVQGVLTQLRTQLHRAGAMPPVVAHHLIAEKRATFAAVPQLARPQQKTPWPGVFVAGDWTDTSYPAVLEGAVRSGLQAASLASES